MTAPLHDFNAQSKAAVNLYVQGWRRLLDYEEVPGLESFLSAFELEAKEGGPAPFILNPIQQQIVATIEEVESRGVPVRVLILKARQVGCSTLIGGRIFEKVIRHGGRKALIMCHNEKDTREIYESKVIGLWNQIPEAVRPERDVETRMELIIQHGAKEMAQGIRPKKGRKGRSYVRVLTAGKTTGARSQNVQDFFGSEVAFFRNARTVLNATFKSIGYKPGTSVILETTGNGASGAFYDLWVGAIRKENDYVPLFFPWFSFPEYRKAFKAREEKSAFMASLSEEEEALMVAHKLDAEQLRWRRWEIANECFGDPLLFSVEYPSTWEDSFLASGTCRFDKAALLALKAVAAKPIGVGEILMVNGSYRFVPQPASFLTVYRTPVKDREYIIGADTAEGIRANRYEDRPDFSAACVYERSTRRLAARIHGRIDPEDYGNLLNRVGRYYNEALIVAENNGVGMTLIQRLRQLKYPSLYISTVIDSVTGEKRNKLGFTMTVSMRKYALSHLASEIVKRRIDLSEEQVRECQNFVTKDGIRFEAAEESHDDEVMALAMFCAVNRREYRKGTEKPPEKSREMTKLEKWEDRAFERLVASRADDSVDSTMGSEW